MELMRLVVTGTPGAGKSSFVQAASQIKVIDTDKAATDDVTGIKPKTTVAFDFGRVTIGSEIELHVYGTPGQSRFNFMWDILISRAHAYLLLIAAHRPHDVPKARHIISFMNERVQIPMVIGLTHLDCPGACSAEEILLRLGYTSNEPHPSVLAVNASNKQSVHMALNIALLSILMSQGKSQRQEQRSPQQPVHKFHQARLNLTVT
jgi:hypothetical protein